MHILAKKPRSTASAGFTIIETLIVLVIAGLILLIVFDAIPALTRNSRNNQRKQDVQAILGVVSNYELNNSGNFPQCGYGAYPSCFVKAWPGCVSTQYVLALGNTGACTNNLQYVKLNYYTTPGQVIVYTQQNTNSGGAYFAKPLTSLYTRLGVPALDHVDVYNYERCDPTTPGATTTVAAGYNDYVALYAIETGSTATSISGECAEL
jgi:prepilin-type N-terminal cleavage/methylation domain-containing protein